MRGRCGPAVIGGAALAIAVIATLATSPTATSTATAADTSDAMETLLIEGTGSSAERSAAAKRDDAQLSRQTGMSLEEAARRGSGGVELAKLASWVERRYPDLYAGSGLTPESSDLGAYLTLTGPPREDLLATARKLSIDVEIRVRATLSEDTWVALSATAIKVVTDAGIDYASSSIDRESSTIEIEYGGEGADELDADELERRAAQALVRAVREFDLAVPPGVDLPAVTVTRNDEMATMSEAAGAGFMVGGRGGETVLVTTPPSGGGLQARFEGTLAAEDGCLGLRAGRHFWVMVAASTMADWDGTILQLTPLEGPTRSYRLGDRIVLGGGEFRPSRGTDAGPQLPASCDAHPRWLVSEFQLGT